MSLRKITEFEVGERLDKALAKSLTEYSRSSLEKLIEADFVTVNGMAKPASYKMRASDLIEINLQPLEESPEEIDLPIIYEDDDVVVIDKPAGLLTHSKGAFNPEATVATFLKTYLTRRVVAARTLLVEDEFWSSDRAGIVHRLDRGTSGVIICAKNEPAQKHLQKQFSTRKVKKIYLAVITNELPEKAGLIDVPIERNPKKPSTFRAGINGKSAQTEFAILSTNVQRPTSNVYSLVELKPYTGRTHQLRVHLAHLKCPILGDELYGGKTYARMMLHAHKLEITLPSKERKIFEAPVPREFQEI